MSSRLSLITSTAIAALASSAANSLPQPIEPERSPRATPLNLNRLMLKTNEINQRRRDEAIEMVRRLQATEDDTEIARLTRKLQKLHYVQIFQRPNGHYSLGQGPAIIAMHTLKS